MTSVPIERIKLNPMNPRTISESRFEKLKKSLQDFPGMLDKRPLVVYTDTDGFYVVLGGNMRLRAAQELGFEKLPIIVADDWTVEQKSEFLIKDNLSFGEWDMEELANSWEQEDLVDWGMDLPTFDTNIDLNNFFEDSDKEKSAKHKIVLEYSEEEYNAVNEAFKALSGSKEQIVFKLLGL